MSHYDYGCVQEVICNENNVYPAMKDLIENHHMSVKGAAIFVQEDSGGKVTEERARQVYIRRTKCSIEQSGNPSKTQTKPEIKIQISEIVKEIKSGAVSDDHAKQIGDALADAITDGICAKRVGTKVHTAVRKKNLKGREVKVQEPNNYRRLWNHILAASSGLQLMIDGAMSPPQIEEEAEAIHGIMAALPNICLQTARMGVNLMEIHDVFYKGVKDETKYIEERQRDP